MNENKKEQPLITRYRPSSFAQFAGNEQVVKTLKKMLQRDGHPHSFLFTGPIGCGKTTMARIVAKKIGASGFYDLKECDSIIGIADAEKIIPQARYCPYGKARAFFFDESQNLKINVQNKFLKLFEEPPSRTYFILATSQPEKLIEPLRSRLTTFELQLLTNDEMVEFLTKICRKERQNLPAKTIKRIAAASKGYPREALKLLDIEL